MDKENQDKNKDENEPSLIPQIKTLADAERLVEALLFASTSPLTSSQIRAQMPEELGLDLDISEILNNIQAEYAGRGVVLNRRDSGWAFRTAPDLSHHFTHIRKTPQKLSRAAIETLAVIAYHQPVTRAEIEAVRGVASSKGTLDLLMEAGWVKPGRRRQTPGRPLTWISTTDFLDQFGLEDLKDLPGIEELKAAGLLDTRPAISTVMRNKNEPELPMNTEQAAADDAEAEIFEDAEREGHHNLT